MAEITNKSRLYVTMPDSSVWAVPCAVIIKNRLDYYQGRGKATDVDFDPDEEEILDWAANNMDWSDVEKHATKISDGEVPDYEEGWANGDKRVDP